jgi:hypothetical protein
MRITDPKKTKEIVVTRGVYENLYKDRGYTIVSPSKPKVDFQEATIITDTIKKEQIKSDLKK